MKISPHAPFGLVMAVAAAGGAIPFAHAKANTHPHYESHLNPRHSDLLPNDDGLVLASIFGSEETRDNFFANHFGSDIVHMQRTESDLHSPVKDLTMSELFASSDMALRNWGSSEDVDKNKMTFQDFEEYIQKGGSAVAHIVNDQTLFPIKAHIEDSLGMPISMNVYHSGPEGVALYPHTDRYDVIVLHLEGEKEWEICIPDDNNDDDNNNSADLTSADVADIKEVELANVAGCTTHEGESRSTMVCSNTTMTPGDVLYLPKGIVHSATTSPNSPSTTHITIGLVRDNLRYGDFLKSLLVNNADLLSKQLTHETGSEETQVVFLREVIDEILEKDQHEFGLGLRRMMPSWVWGYYGACVASVTIGDCDEAKFNEAKVFLLNSLVAMLDDLKVATSDYIHNASSEPTDDENNTENDDKPVWAGENGWLIELEVQTAIDSLKNDEILTAAIDKHLAVFQGWRAKQKIEERMKREEGMSVAERKAEMDRVINEQTFLVIKELSSGKYPEYDHLQSLMEQDEVDEFELLLAQRALSDSAACVAACDVVEFVCKAACDLISVGADVCKVGCDAVFGLCPKFKTAGCDGAPCFGSCDASPCFTSCDKKIFCTRSCDRGCFGSCDGWLGAGSCDSRCAFGCDSGCVGTSCDSSCTLGCDSRCTTSCDEFGTVAKKCIDGKAKCHQGCEAAEEFADQCRSVCETDLNACSVMCGFVDMALDAVSVNLKEKVQDAISAINSIIDELVEAVESIIFMLEAMGRTVTEAYEQVNAGARDLVVNTEVPFSLGPTATAILDVVVNLLAFNVGVFTGIMAFLPFVGLAGISLSFGLTVGLSTFVVSISILSEDGNPLGPFALLLEACVGLQVGLPSIGVSVAVGYGITFGSVMTYEDVGMVNVVDPPSISLGQQISISTNFLTFFGFPVVLGGSVGWGLANSNGRMINPFATAPNAAGFSIEVDTADFDPSGLISVEYAVCGAFGYVAGSIFDRKLKDNGSVVFDGIEFTDADALRDYGENIGRRLYKGRALSGGTEAFDHIKNTPGYSYRKWPEPSHNKQETAEEHVAGGSPFDRTVTTEPDFELTPEQLDNQNFQRLVDTYNLYFKDDIFGGMPLSEAMETFDDDQMEALLEMAGGSVSSIEGNINDFE